MALDSDVVLFGMGLAPLAAAARLIAEGQSVLLLNPDFDFFREDSELPFDEWVEPEQAAAALRPDYPGAVELWTDGRYSDGFHDRAAPHVRGRSWLWIAESRDPSWEKAEAMYLQASDRGLRPQLLEGIRALSRFPGLSLKKHDESPEAYRGVMLPRVAEADVERYRSGLLEYLIERLGPERVQTGVSQVEPTPEGVRFQGKRGPMTAKLRKGMMVFWTPRMTAWVAAHTRKDDIGRYGPTGVRFMEQWRLLSREKLDPGLMGRYGNLTVWSETEGAPGPHESLHVLSVLRPGAVVPLAEFSSAARVSWGSADSFQDLGMLCNEFLGWERFSIRGLRPRAVFEWNGEPESWSPRPGISVVGGCDGPMVKVVSRARKAAGAFL